MIEKIDFKPLALQARYVKINIEFHRAESSRLPNDPSAAVYSLDGKIISRNHRNMKSLYQIVTERRQYKSTTNDPIATPNSAIKRLDILVPSELEIIYERCLASISQIWMA
jgi:hypothetical protein